VVQFNVGNFKPKAAPEIYHDQRPEDDGPPYTSLYTSLFAFLRLLEDFLNRRLNSGPAAASISNLKFMPDCQLFGALQKRHFGPALPYSKLFGVPVPLKQSTYDFMEQSKTGSVRDSVTD
jgi:hypothetical protein